MPPQVRIDSVSKTFGGACAVDNVSIDVPAGELFFLLGPSGCGKTTLLRCIAGFCVPDRGRIHIGSREITRTPPHRRNAAMVFQSYALWPHLAVRRNIAFGLEMRGVKKPEIRRRVAEALETVRMSEYADRRPNQLSGGQQQRVALARALVVHPDCLLLDEPLSNLDAKLRLEMRVEIRRICKEAGLTAVYVTHDQKEALSMADRIAVMHDGRLEQVGAPREVYDQPANRFVAGFIGETNFLEGRLRGPDDGLWLVDTPIGRIVAGRLAAGVSTEPGVDVTLSVRPESIRLSPVPVDARNIVEGRLLETVYLGEVAQHRMGLRPGNDANEGEVEVKGFDLNPRLGPNDAGSAISVWIDPLDVVVLEA